MQTANYNGRLFSVRFGATLGVERVSGFSLANFGKPLEDAKDDCNSTSNGCLAETINPPE